MFDLDNTLYSPTAGILGQVDVLMTDFIHRALGLTRDHANQLRRTYWERYGATLTGLVAEHGVDPDEFLDASHRLDLSALTPEPNLLAALADLPGRQVIHTNGPRRHALRVLEKLGLDQHFERVIALEDTGYVPKPAAKAHQVAALQAGWVPDRTAMIDDAARNLAHPAEMGLTTIWLNRGETVAPPLHVDHIAHDLIEFLGQVKNGDQSASTGSSAPTHRSQP